MLRITLLLLGKGFGLCLNDPIEDRFSSLFRALARYLILLLAGEYCWESEFFKRLFFSSFTSEI